MPAALRTRLSPLAAPSQLELDVVRLWALDTTGGDRLAARLAPLLPPGERPTSVARTPRAATRCTAAVLARVALRALAQRPEEPLRSNAHGRPAWPAGPAFSLSYAGPLAVIALADAAVGVDVEVDLDPQADPLALAETAGFTPSERAAIAADPAPSGGFTRLWTLKEAIAKAAGTGIGSAAWHAPVRCCDAAQTVRCTTGTGTVAAIQAPAGHHIAVARWWPAADAPPDQAASLSATAGGGSLTNSGGQMSR